MLKIKSDQAQRTMAATHPPVATVQPGEIFKLAVQDCYSGRLQSPDDKFTREMWDSVNPATGPVYIADMAPGDVLRVEILAISVRDFAVMCLEPGSGALGRFIPEAETTILPIRDGRLILDHGLELPLNPMIGVIGTAPAGEPILNGTPGEHGGNMDCNLITAGAVVYLPVQAPGALLSMGDLHALMGDGEVCICGAEVAGEITLRAGPGDRHIPTPCVETADHFHFLASALTLDECEPLVLEKAHRFLTNGGITPNAAARRMSLLGQLGVCQVVDPLKTMRFSLPKLALGK
ncbi:MAG: acetamidase/formamidase family protein [Kiritimatiellia bacterium]|nr:acetamidase/formamidase family protein [Lentisphaerota bacterium]